MAICKSEVDAWISLTAQYKKVPEHDIANALTTALQTVYTAVAFDIDGTLTLPDSTSLDPAMCKVVARLLRRGCHVWFVTGRGSAGAAKAGDELIAHTDLSLNERLRLRCITHNGGRVRQTDPSRPDEFFASVEALVEPFEGIEKLKDDVDDAFSTAQIVPQALTLEPGDNDSAFGLRIVFNEAGTRDTAAQLLKRIADKDDRLTLRTGVYGNVYTIDLTTADKAGAVSRLASMHHLDPTRVLRIGDQGEDSGNDGSFLAASSGFSVGTVSRSPDRCFPVADRDGKLLQGPAATHRLVEALLIGAPLRMELEDNSDSRQALLHRLLDFERGAVYRASNETRMIERQLSLRIAQLVAHDPGDGDFTIAVGDLFDSHSGGIRIRDWDLHDLMPSAAIADLFGFDMLNRGSADAIGPRRCMYTDSGVLLRGPDYYMSLTNRRGAEHVPSYICTAAEFVSKALRAIDELCEHQPDVVRVRVALAIMDNIRDVMLQLLNIALFNAQPPGDTTELDRRLVGDIGNLAAAHTCTYVDFLLEPHNPWTATLSKCREPIAKLQDWLEANRSDLVQRVAERASRPEWQHGDKRDVFRWREADYIVQNLSAVVIGLRAVASRPSENTDKPILAVGLQYGGLELPLLAAALGPRFGLQLIPAVMRISMYGNEEQGDQARKNLDNWVAESKPEDFPVILLGLDKSYPTPIEGTFSDVMLFDDNCTTGTTVQAARDMLIRRGCDVRAVVIVRFPGANRAAQMSLPQHGFLDIDLAHNFVYGLVGPSPYSRLVLPHPDSSHKYEDENGVFDKAKLRIRLLLHKNSPKQYPTPLVSPWGTDAST